ncbi:MAG: MarR family transcriptional regulator [Verrucomicrobiota bacterium]
MSQLDQSIGLKLRAAYLSFHRRAQATLAPHGLTADQFVVLSFLAEKDGVRQRDLVDATSSDSSTIGAMLKLLQERDLVERIPSDSDRRSMLVYLTSKGLDLQNRLVKVVGDIRIDLHDAVTDDAMPIVTAALDRVAAAMQIPANGSDDRT